MKQSKSNPMIKLTSDDLNTLIHNYFVDESYPLALEAFKKEVSVILNIKYTLIDLVYYGAKYIYIKQHVHKIGCREIFCLSEDHHCKFYELEDADDEDIEKRGCGMRRSLHNQHSEDEEGLETRRGEMLVHEKGHTVRIGSNKILSSKKQTDENRVLFEQIKSMFKLSQRKKEYAHDARSNESECDRSSIIARKEGVKRGDRSSRSTCDSECMQNRRTFEREECSSTHGRPECALSASLMDTAEFRHKCTERAYKDSPVDSFYREAHAKDDDSHHRSAVECTRTGEKGAASTIPRLQYHVEYDVLNLEEHFSRTSLCAWSNSKLLATAGSEGRLRVFLGQCIFNRDVHSEITALDFQGNVVACGSYNGEVAVFDVKTQQEFCFRNFRGRVNVVKADKADVIAGSDDGCISMGSKTFQCSLGKVFDVERVKDSIAVATEDGVVRMVSAPSGMAFGRTGERCGYVHCTDRYNEGYIHYESTALSSPYTHDVEGSESSRRAKDRFADLVGHRGPVNSIKHYGDYLASASGDATVKVWNLKSMREERSFKHGGEVFRVQIKDEKIYSCSSDGTLRVWSFDRQINAFCHEGGVFTFDKKTLVVSGSIDNTVRVWDERVGEVMRHQTKGPVYTVSFSHDERLVCVCSGNESPVVLDLRRV